MRRDIRRAGSAFRRLLARPFSLSCLLHAAAFAALGFAFASSRADVPPEKPPPVVEMAMETPTIDAPEVSGEAAGEGNASGAAGTAAVPAAAIPAVGAPRPSSMTVAGVPVSTADVSATATSASVTAGGAAPAAGDARTGGAPTAARGGDAGDAAQAGGAGGASPAGESAAGTALQAPTESAGDIAARFAARVEANKVYPYSAVQRGQTGDVLVRVMLAADGGLLSAEVAVSSGVRSLDESALQAARRSCPFPHGAGHTITLEVGVVYHLNE